MKNKINIKDLGLVDYKQTWDLQESILKTSVNNKLKNKEAENIFLLCEHPHVYTLGKSGTQNNLLISDEFLKKINATYHKINRGGDITYHGPGQIVGYPIIDLDSINIGVKEYVYKLEQVIINVLKKYKIESTRLDGATGVWLDTDKPSVRKICAIGIKVSRGVTMHGFAFNVNTDLEYFNYINPCGFVDKGVTTLSKELSKDILSIGEIKSQIIGEFKKEFGY